MRPKRILKANYDYNFFGRVVFVVLTILLVRVATGILVPEEMGRYSIVLSLVNLFALFLIGLVGFCFVAHAGCALNE